MESELLGAAAGLIAALTPTFPFLLKYKNKATQLKSLLTEVEMALEDNKISQQEMARILKLGRMMLK